MTITPMSVLPQAPRGGGPRAADGKPGQPGPQAAAEDFAAVLSGQLAGAKASRPGSTSPEKDEAAEPAADAAAVLGEALLAGAVGVAVPGESATGPEGVVADGAGPLPGPTASPGATPVLPAGDAAASAPPTANPAAPDTPAKPAPAPTGSATTASTATDPAAAQALADGAALPGVLVQGAGRSSETAPPAAALPTTSEPADATASDPAPMGVPAPAAPVTAAVPAEAPVPAAAPSHPVLAQVTPALARVVTRGDGEHRMMLKLHPADLGEVHLTVTVRGDHVDVEIAAGAQARDVLREGSAHLRSLLESIGRSTGQLVLRDLPVAATSAAGPGAGGPGHDGGGTSYAATGDGRRDQPDTRGGRQQPRTHDQPLDRPPATARVSGRTTVPGASALDVTV
jgi:hypothetical protein